MTQYVRIALLAAGLVLPGALSAQTVAGTVTLSGTSNVHSWTATGSTITARVSGDEVTVTVPVRSLDGSRNGMNSVMQRAMNVAAHPNVTFTTTAPVDYSGPVRGTLTVNGQTRTVAFTVTRTGDTVAGSTRVRMTDFGVRPPTAMLGAVRSGDDVTIRFDATIPAALR